MITDSSLRNDAVQLFLRCETRSRVVELTVRPRCASQQKLFRFIGPWRYGNRTSFQPNQALRVLLNRSHRGPTQQIISALADVVRVVEPGREEEDWCLSRGSGLHRMVRPLWHHRGGAVPLFQDYGTTQSVPNL